MNHLTQTLVCGLLVAFLLSVCGCGTPEPTRPAGLSMAQLKAQNRAPLEIAQFTASATVSDAILGVVVDAADESKKEPSGKVAEKEGELIVRRHLLTVTNVSNCLITGFRAKITYEDEKGQAVISENATAETNYIAEVGNGIAPGADEQLVLQLRVPKDAKVKFQLILVLYKDGSMGGMWTPEKGESKPVYAEGSGGTAKGASPE